MPVLQKKNKMLSIHLNNIGKRYQFQWILRGFDLDVHPADRLAILGPNGSGKSTLMKILSGFLSPSEGKIKFVLDQKEVKAEQMYQQVSFAAPYIHLIDELTLEESIAFHFKFKKPLKNLGTQEILSLAWLERHSDKKVKELSSGMYQRLKLMLALSTQSPLLLLDEPTSYLDESGKKWFTEKLGEFSEGRTLVIASNDPYDLQSCEREISVKPR
jgi:ABC-type multidrug transport system ATPase subunit